MNGSTITLPKKVFLDIIEAAKIFERAQNELEDYLLGQNKKFAARMHMAKKEHDARKFGSWAKIKSRYGV